ncbi:SDR family NAD(P)-dependent oxidoreductase [Labrys monachus]|uniref:NAD(P)-dependent dehydrogenase (Short-subunit alcohol dehydrogenase family) n=1 Tax=Labrys monachus TaxID=217067 RepID=A0ABU0FII6_9HYPH|nr:SDR family oxidoreductase [Labrys monachus]MDQ0394423.1 NAD(P)-dependent dehydrogenase (short-subunit alcohol dehydrogenase family) [Labrys monachus]
MSRFAGRRAIVTGAAGGIGAAVVARLLSEGAAVAALDRDEPALERLAAAPSLHRVAGDLRTPETARAAVAKAVGLLGGPAEIVVSAAGVYALSPAAKVEAQDWDFNQDINLKAPFFVAQAAVAARAAGAAAAAQPMAIVNIASVGAYRSGTGDAALSYSASKGGLVALTRSMAAEWAPQGIRVNVVSPGVIDTAMVRIMDDPDAGSAWLEARVPMGRLGRPDEIAAVVCFLASDEASYVTGAELIADGGYMCR